MHNVLTSIQRTILEGLFRAGLGGRGFFLTGGTALAEYYLGHRYSDDLDFFQRGGGPLPTADVSWIADTIRGMGLEVGPARELVPPPDETKEIQVSRLGTSETPLNVHIARDVHARLDAEQNHGSVVVDSMLDLAVNKVNTIRGRGPYEPKDYCDLFFILHGPSGGISLDHLLARVREKHEEFDHEDAVLQFAVNLRQVARAVGNAPPLRMIKSFSVPEAERVFIPLADALINRYRPRR